MLPVIALLLSLVGVIWLASRTKNQANDFSPNDTSSKFTQLLSFILTVGITGFLYLFLTVFSVFTTDSCGVSGDCNVLMIGLVIGYIWLLVSFFFTFLFALDKRKINIIFLPFIAAPIFIAIVAIAIKLQGM
jgi:hypothetical protein